MHHLVDRGKPSITSDVLHHTDNLVYSLHFSMSLTKSYNSQPLVIYQWTLSLFSFTPAFTVTACHQCFSGHATKELGGSAGQIISGFSICGSVIKVVVFERTREKWIGPIQYWSVYAVLWFRTDPVRNYNNMPMHLYPSISWEKWYDELITRYNLESTTR